MDGDEAAWSWAFGLIVVVNVGGLQVFVFLDFVAVLFGAIKFHRNNIGINFIVDSFFEH